MDRRRFLTALSATPFSVGLFNAMAQAQSLSATRTRFGVTKTRFAVNIETFTFGGLPPEDRIIMAAEFGFDAVEFWDWTQKDIDRMVEAKRAANVEITQFVVRGSVVNSTQRDSFLNNLAEAIPIAHELGVRQLTAIPGMELEELPREDQIAACIESYKQAAPLCEREDITLMIKPLNALEDYPGVLVSRSEEAAHIVREVGSRYIRMVYDVYHQQITEGNLLRNIERYYRQEPLIQYFQIADTPGRHEPGTGEINFRNLLQGVYEIGYRGCVGLELTPRRTEEMALAAVVNADQW